jgi:hypothetical protein
MLHRLTAAGALPANAGPTDLVTHLRAGDTVIVCAAGQLGIAQSGEDLHPAAKPGGATPVLRSPQIPAQRGIQEPHHIHPRKE